LKLKTIETQEEEWLPHFRKLVFELEIARRTVESTTQLAVRDFTHIHLEAED
jgi:hypothetical protein